MELADKTQDELHALYKLKYGGDIPASIMYSPAQPEELLCPIKREFAFRYMMREQGPTMRKMMNAEVEINRLRQDMHNLVQQLNAKQTAYAQPYNPSTPVTTLAQPVTPYPPIHFTPITL